MREQQIAAAQMPSTDNITGKASSTQASGSFYDQLLTTAKPSILVGVIVAVLSLPVLSTVIEKAVNSKESFKKFAMPLTLLIKALIGGGMFYGGSTALEL